MTHQPVSGSIERETVKYAYGMTARQFSVPTDASGQVSIS
jgi:hypothetical protein